MDEKQRTALVVDDDPEIRKLAGAYLQRMGFQVTEAGDGRTAMKLLSSWRPTLLCLDLMLPESSGFEVCEFVLVTPALKGLPIVMMSARSMPEDRAHAEELGVTEYLVKPFSHPDFAQAVRQALAPAQVQAAS